MALHGALFLKLNGAEVPTAAGDDFSARRAGGGAGPNIENCIEFFDFKIRVERGTEGHGGYSTTHRIWYPAEFTSRPGKATPHITKALREGHSVEATFQFFRPNAEGTVEVFHTYKLEDGRIVGHEFILPNTMNPETSNSTMLQKVLISGHKIHTESVHGSMDDDDWRGDA